MIPLKVWDLGSNVWFKCIHSFLFLRNMVKPGTFIFWDASRLFWFKGLLDNISIRFMRSFSSQTKYTGEFGKLILKWYIEY